MRGLTPSSADVPGRNALRHTLASGRTVDPPTKPAPSILSQGSNLPMRMLSAVTGGASLFVSQPLAEVHPVRPVELVAALPVARTMVGDWEPPHAVVMVYTDGWDDTLASMLEAISGRIPVLMLLEQGLSIERAADALDRFGLAQGGRIVTTELTVDSVWARDYAPLQVWEPDVGLIWLDAPYDSERPLDDDLPLHLTRWSPTPTEGLAHSIDGGAVASSGDRLCVSTVEYFLDNEIDWNDQDELDPLLLQLGCERMVLVPALIAEETKHIDVFMQFVEPEVVAIASYDPSSDPEDAERMDAAATAVREAADHMGKSLTVVRIPSPSPRGRDYPSYTNFLRLSDVALVPSYSNVRFSPEEDVYARLQAVMPGVELIAIPADVPVDYGGAVHCLTWGLQRAVAPRAPQVARRRPISRSDLRTRRRTG